MAKKRKARVNKKKPETENNPFWAFLDRLPIFLSFSFAIFGAFLLVLLILEQYRNWYILASAIFSFTVSFLIIKKNLKPIISGSLRETRIVNIIALVFILGWMIFNSFYASQNIFQLRDPSVYNITSRWLMDHENLNIPVDNSLLADNTNKAGFKNQGPGFYESSKGEGRVYAQGIHLLPALTSLTGRLTDESKALKTNVLIGAMALLSLFGFMKLLVRPRFALLGVMTFSVSLPFLYFSRDMYSEPLLIMFLFAGLTALYQAMKSNIRTLWIVSGLLFGATTFARTDSLLIFAGLIAATSVYLVFVKKKQLSNELKNYLLFTLSFTLFGIIGWLDLILLSKYYYRTLAAEQDINLVPLALFVLFIFGFAFVYISSKTKFLKMIITHKVKLSIVLFISLSIILTIVVVSPLLQTNSTHSYEIREIGAFQSPILIRNTTEHIPAESSSVWIERYFSLVVAVLAIVGLFILVNKILKEKDKIYLLPFLLISLGLIILYFYDPKITPDHVWASRRFLPVIFPAVIIYSMIALERFDSRLKSTKHKTAYFIVVALLVIYPVFHKSKFYILEKTHEPSLTQIGSLCGELPENSVVLLAGTLSQIGVQTIRTYCKVDTYGYYGLLSTEAYQEFYKYSESIGKTPIVAFFFNEHGVTTLHSVATRLGEYHIKDIEKLFNGLPTKMYEGDQEITAGILKSNGDLKEIRNSQQR